MVEKNLFKPIDSTSIYNDYIGHVTLYDASHANESEEQRIYTVTTIASLAYGNEEARNPEALYERMKSIKHESLWEFIRDADNSKYSIDESMRCSYGLYDQYYYSDVKEHKQNIACFRIKVPIFVARQFMRHRSFSYLEMSRRYTKDAKVPFEFWFPANMKYQIREIYAEQFNNDYKYLVENDGYHTQIASRFLPQTTYTEFYIMGEVEGLRNFFRLRLDEHAQAEIREVARAMADLLQDNQYELYTKVVINETSDS